MHKKNSLRILKVTVRVSLTLLVSISIFLLSAELVIRALPDSGAKYKLDNFASDNPNIKNLNRMSTFRPSAILGYEKIPHSAPEINSYGMIGKEYRLKKAKNIFRILVLGDSITELAWYAEYLEDKLNKNPLLKYKFEVWNAGVMGYEATQYLNYLRFKGVKFSPDMVIVGFCLNDFNVPGTTILYRGNKGFYGYYYPGSELSRIIPINRFLFKYSYLYRFLFAKVDVLLSNIHSRRITDEKAKLGFSVMGEIKDICERKNIPLFTAIFPYLKTLDEYSPVEKDEYRNMLDVLNGLGIAYVDLHGYFPRDKERLNALRRFESDYIHPDEAGHEIVAQALYDQIVGRYFQKRDALAQ